MGVIQDNCAAVGTTAIGSQSLGAAAFLIFYPLDRYFARTVDISAVCNHDDERRPLRFGLLLSLFVGAAASSSSLGGPRATSPPPCGGLGAGGSPSGGGGTFSCSVHRVPGSLWPTTKRRCPYSSDGPRLCRRPQREALRGAERRREPRNRTDDGNLGEHEAFAKNKHWKSALRDFYSDEKERGPRARPMHDSNRAGLWPAFIRWSRHSQLHSSLRRNSPSLTRAARTAGDGGLVKPSD
jgi:hypothetical protein